MNKRTLLIIGGVVILAGIFAVGWYLGSPLLIDNTVDEAFPFDVPDEETIATMLEADREELEKDFMEAVPDEETIENLSPEDLEAVTEKVMNAAAVVMMDEEAADDMMTDEWKAVSRGEFVDADSFHQGSGSVAIYQQEGQRVLRFEEFSTTNGPDLHVILARHPSPEKHSDLGEDYIDLGPLKGNIGDQNYEIPDGVDLSGYQSVVIYCVPFHVVFTTATLG